MGTWNGQKLAGAAGVLFIVINTVTVVMVSPPPDAGDPAAKFLEYFADHRNTLLAQMLIGLWALVPAFIFAAGLRRLLGRDEQEGGVLAAGAVVAFVVGVAMVAVMTGWLGGLAYLGDGNGLDEGSAKTLSLLGTMVSFSAINATFGTTEVVSGYLLLKGSTVPKWLGWIGLVGGLILYAGMFSVAKSGAFMPFGVVSFAGLIAFSIYVLLLSVFMFLRAK